MLNLKFSLRMKDILKDDYLKYENSLKEEIIKAFRINNNYITNEEFLKNFNFDIKKIDYEKDGYYLFSDISGNSLIHQTGLIYFQEASAMMPVNCIDIKEDAFVLDLCSSPGGKSLQILSRIKNGFLVCNEVDKSRIFSLYSNITRLGYNNYAILNDLPSKLELDFKECFDYILTDVPCSGEGMFRKDENAIKFWSEEHVLSCKKRDFKIIDSAINMLKNGGFLIYSTCTFSKEENEDVCEYIKNKGLIEVDVNDKIVSKTVSDLNLNKGRRFYPYLGYGEGQYMAVFKKDFGLVNEYNYSTEFKKNLVFENFLNKYLISKIDYRVINNKVYYIKKELKIKYSNVITRGVLLGEIKKDYFLPEHDFFKTFGKLFKLNYELNDLNMAKKYLKGEELYIDGLDGFGVFTYKNGIIGGFKAVNGRIKNYYPKSLRINLKEDFIF